MTYTAGQLILDDEYNIFVAGNATFGSLNHGVANLNTVWGEGFGDKGYGMSMGRRIWRQRIRHDYNS
jgi:hypothetical protein